MNERIKELKKQALEYAMAVNVGHIVPPLDKEVWPLAEVFDEKFAELIVRECVDVANSKAEGIDLGSKLYLYKEDIEDTIKKHFGVEE